MIEIESLRLPPGRDVGQNLAYRYYFTDEFGFARAAVRHIRRRRIEAVLGLLTDVSARDVLDVGCGPGESAIYLQRHFGESARVVAVDIGWEFVTLGEHLAKANHAPTRFLQAEACVLPFPANSFDVVTTLELVEHLPNWRHFLQEAHRVLRPGGHVVISTPTRAGFHSWLKRAWVRLRRLDTVFERYKKPGDPYERFIGRREMAEALHALGYERISEIVKIFVFSFLPDGLFVLNRFVEPVLEAVPGVRQLGVTALYHYRKRE
jgi:ubiquinone/menaquinone biosynthesis C-methylase UbiE